MEADYAKSWYCDQLSTRPVPEKGLILVTGATGYIGGRLVPELLARKYRIRVMVRTYSADYAERWPGAEVVEGDALNLESLLAALEGVDTAYYLIHSLLLGQKKFEETDIQAAVNFRTAAENQKISSIIYLGGLGDINTTLSAHLKNRTIVGEKLSTGSIPVTILRAGMIIGSGSASYEILSNLVRNTPIFFIPKWARTQAQPIALRDVIKYLVGVLELEEASGREFDIGGSTVLTYDEKLIRLSQLLGKKRLFLPALITTPALYGYLASLLTPVPGPITKVLVRGCKNEVICQNSDIRELIPFEPLGFDEAIREAVEIEAKDEVTSRWSDSFPSATEVPLKLTQIHPLPRYNSSYCLLTHKEPSDIFRSFCSIGGKRGWFHGNWMWRLRGMVDRLLLGAGSSRGRRSYSELRVDDVIDFFRVEDIRKDKQLLLRAEMILPGKAWLEFIIDSYDDLQKLTITAYFQPKGIWGFMYWYFFLPFHFYIFKTLIKKIEKKS
jgi:uncharacterized protein YbjT (DUF2867 family)